MLSIIVAYDQNRVIGNKGKIPWHIPDDFKHFRRMTTGHCVIMGRKTWDSLPAMLPNRYHYVFTRNIKGVYNKIGPEVVEVNNFQFTIDLIRHAHPGKIGWVIGGSEIYKLALDEGWVDRIVATEVKGIHEGDAFFPEIDNSWSKIPMETHELFDVFWYVKK